MKYFAHSKVGQDYRTTIPPDVRELLGKLEINDILLYVRDGDRVYISKGKLSID